MPENLIMVFFQKLGTIPFPEEALVQHIPETVSMWGSHWGHNLCPWPWVVRQELALAGFCTPTTVVSPEHDFDVISLTWTFLLHIQTTQLLS